MRILLLLSLLGLLSLPFVSAQSACIDQCASVEGDCMDDCESGSGPCVQACQYAYIGCEAHCIRRSMNSGRVLGKKIDQLVKQMHVENMHSALHSTLPHRVGDEDCSDSCDDIRAACTIACPFGGTACMNACETQHATCEEGCPNGGGIDAGCAACEASGGSCIFYPPTGAYQSCTNGEKKKKKARNHAVVKGYPGIPGGSSGGSGLPCTADPLGCAKKQRKHVA